jgi:hypothetical protein
VAALQQGDEKMRRLSIFLFTMVLVFGVAGITSARLITQDVIFDLEAGYPYGYINQGAWEGRSTINEVSFQTGDIYILKIRFANNKALQIGDVGDELYKVRMLFKDPSQNSWQVTGKCTFLGVGGELLLNPAPFQVSGSGQAYAGPFTSKNLTDTSFYYNGVDVEINFTSYNLVSGSGIFDRVEWSSGGGAQIIDWAVPNPVPPGLVGYWNFDEGEGAEAGDSSGYENDGDVFGTKDWVPGRCGNAALSFDAGADGSVDYVKVLNSDSINTSTFTVSFWVSLSDLAETMVFLHKRNVQWGRNFQISYNTVGPNNELKDYLKVKIDNGATSNDFDNAAYAEVNLEIDRYYYVVGTYDQDKLKLYLDGIKIAEHSINMTDNVGDGDLYIGAHSADYPYMNPTNGIIDEVRIYNYALTQEQIQADMEACVPPNQPPVADAGPDQTVDADSACTGTVTLDGSASSDPDEDIVSWEWFEDGTPLGSGETLSHAFVNDLGDHIITLVVTDSFGETNSDEVTITMVDTTPPELSVSISPDTLWPPNHKMVLCTPTIIVSDNCDPDPIVQLVSVTSNESEEAYTYDPAFDMYTSEGHTDGDIQIVNDFEIYLRAERSGEGDGRIYTITYEATDFSGNTASASATVTVPHNQ